MRSIRHESLKVSWKPTKSSEAVFTIGAPSSYSLSSKRECQQVWVNAVYFAETCPVFSSGESDGSSC